MTAQTPLSAEEQLEIELGEQARINADDWSGAVELRGLPPGAYRLSDPFHGTDLGVVSGPGPTVDLTFRRFQLVVAEPV